MKQPALGWSWIGLSLPRVQQSSNSEKVSSPAIRLRAHVLLCAKCE
jgi:hypothetical protein